MNAQYTPQEARAMEDMLCRLYRPTPPKPTLTDKQIQVRDRRNAILGLIRIRTRDMQYLKRKFPSMTQGQIGRDIDALVKWGKVKREGRGNKSHYVFASQPQERVEA